MPLQQLSTTHRWVAGVAVLVHVAGWVGGPMQLYMQHCCAREVRWCLQAMPGMLTTPTYSSRLRVMGTEEEAVVDISPEEAEREAALADDGAVDELLMQATFCKRSCAGLQMQQQKQVQMLSQTLSKLASTAPSIKAGTADKTHKVVCQSALGSTAAATARAAGLSIL